MIVYICRQRHAYTLGVQLHFFPGKLAAHVRLVPYELIYFLKELPAAAYIFTDLDRLTPEELSRAARLADHLAVSGWPVLNHPRRALFRFDLLRRLHDLGLNDYNVFRLHDWQEAKRFPVFIRREMDHKGPRSPLLPDAAALSSAVHRFRRDRKADELMIIEFANAPYADGRYRKYGVQRIGDRLFHQHCYVTKDWLGKSVPPDIGPAEVAESREAVRANPNLEKVGPIFDLAGVDYGRMDYSVMKGRIQVYEINTNPAIIGVPSERNPLVESDFFAALHESQMLPLADFEGPPLPMPSDLAGRRRTLSADEANARTLAAMHGRIHFRARRRRIWRMLTSPFGSARA